MCGTHLDPDEKLSQESYPSYKIHVMGPFKLKVLSFATLFTLSTATPLLSPNPNHDLLPRQEPEPEPNEETRRFCGDTTLAGTGYTGPETTHCPMMHYTTYGRCYSTKPAKADSAFIAASGLAHAARMFLLSSTVHRLH